ncbi:MAG: EthD domain-containing protein [Solirubrobacteraceae bacterium]
MRRFMDLDASTWLLTTEELTIADVDEGEPGARVIMELRRAPGTGTAAFEASLRAHAAVAAAVPGVRRLAQFFPIPGANAIEDNYDGVQLLAFDDLEVVEEAWAGPAVQRDLLGDLGRFCDMERSGLMVAHAVRVE